VTGEPSSARGQASPVVQSQTTSSSLFWVSGLSLPHSQLHPDSPVPHSGLAGRLLEQGHS
jgi:hypothetical protein